MTDNVTVTNAIWTYIMPIAGLVIAAITAFGVFYGPKLAAQRQEKREKLKKHFNDLQDGAIVPLDNITRSINIKNGDIITNSPETFEHLDSEQYECFQAHYPILGDKWQELAGKWTKHKGRTGGRWTEHNEKVEVFENNVEEFIKQRLAEKRITLPIKPYRVQEELISDNLPRALVKTFWERAKGVTVAYDFTEATITEDSGFYILELKATKWVNAKNRDKVEKCVSVFADIQNSPNFRKEVSSLLEEAKQIRDEFKELLLNLEKIQSRGLISKDPKYKFKSIKKCHVCKEIFY